MCFSGEQRKSRSDNSSVYALQQDLSWVNTQRHNRPTRLFISLRVDVCATLYVSVVLQGRSSSDHCCHEKVLWGQNPPLSTAISKQVRAWHAHQLEGIICWIFFPSQVWFCFFSVCFSDSMRNCTVRNHIIRMLWMHSHTKTSTIWNTV